MRKLFDLVRYIVFGLFGLIAILLIIVGFEVLVSPEGIPLTTLGVAPFYQFLKLSHGLIAAQALGAAICLDIVFMVFLIKDYKVNDSHKTVMQFLVTATEIGFILLFVTGWMFLFYKSVIPGETFVFSQKLEYKMVITSILFINAIFLHKYIMPQIFDQKSPVCLKDIFVRDDKPVFVASLLPTISFFGWVTAFLIGMHPQLFNAIPVYWWFHIGWAALVLLSSLGVYFLIYYLFTAPAISRRRPQITYHEPNHRTVLGSVTNFQKPSQKRLTRQSTQFWSL